ncbi:MAG: hypothetical protein FJZ59_01010 [Chlamydiae bacterium]|nr:hypothetical protein [Chlamydiota bacterium]
MGKAETIFFGSFANRRLLEGMKIAYDAIIESFQKPADEEDRFFLDIEEKDPSLKGGIYFMQKAFLQKNKFSGTLASILLYKLSDELFQMISLGYNPIVLKDSLTKAKALFLSGLKTKTAKLNTEEKRHKFAKTFIPEDDQLLKTVLEALEKSGEEQNIVVKYNPLISCKLELAHGVFIKSGLMSHYFMTNQEDMSLELENVNILCSEKEITSSFEILDLLKHSPLLIIAPDIKEEALSSIIANRLENHSQVCPIKTSVESAYVKKIYEELRDLKKAQKIYADIDCTVIFKKTKSVICIIHTNLAKKNISKIIETLKLCLNETFLSKESELISTLQEIDPSAFSPSEKPVLAALEKVFSSIFKMTTNSNLKEIFKSFYLLSQSLEVATSILSPLLLSELLLVEQPR